jgi:hypothetical protein
MKDVHVHMRAAVLRQGRSPSGTAAGGSATMPHGERNRGSRGVDAQRAPAAAGRVLHAAPDETAGLRWTRGITDDVVETPIDSDLMARVAAGDHEAFATLYDRHMRAVYGAVLRYLRDPGAAEEVAQETYLAMWQRPDRNAADKGSLVGWLLRF